MAFCTNCGNQNQEGAKVCAVCGNPMSQTSSKSDPNTNTQKPASSGRGKLGLGILIGAVMAAAVILALFLFLKPTKQDQIEGKGFATPLSAAEGYVEAWAKQDLDAMLATFAIESWVENYDKDAYNHAWAKFVNELMGVSEDDPQSQVYYFQNAVGFPLVNTQLSDDLSIRYHAEQIQSKIRSQYLEYALRNMEIEENDKSDCNVRFDSEEEYQQALRLLTDSNVFKNITLISVQEWQEIVPTEKITEFKTSSLLFRDDIRAALGVEDYTQSLAEIEIDGNRWFLSLSQVKYHGRWYNYSFGNELISIINPMAESGSGLAPAP